MATAETIPAWIALFLGLYVLAACITELRTPGSWKALIDDFEGSPALRFVTGLVTFALGTVIYLVTPWNPADWLSIFVSVLGGITLAKGLFFIAAPDRLMNLGRKVMARSTGLIAGINAVLGAALLFAALSRLQFV